MLLKIKNHGNSFRTITSGELPAGGVTEVEAWEAHMWISDCTKKIEIIDDKPKKKKK